MSKTVSARIKPEVHEKLREQCNKIGCSINDFIEECIELGLNGSSQFNFGDERPIPEQSKIHDSHEHKIPRLHFHWEGDKIVQGETTWEEN